MKVRIGLLVLLGSVTVYGLGAHSEGGLHGMPESVALNKKTHANPVLSEPVSGQRIRLGNYGDGPGDLGRGVLEVYRAGRWGLVCDDNWSLPNAHVACRELGFTLGARRAVDTSDHPIGPWSDDSFVLDDVSCRGNESSLLECGYTSQHNCHVFEAVSIVCQPNQGCGGSWVAGPTVCYLMKTHPRVRVFSADEMCYTLGGYLANVDSILENDFLSTTLQTLYPERKTWMIGGKYQSNKWIWKTLQRKKKNDRRRTEKWKKILRRKQRRKKMHNKLNRKQIRKKRDKNILEEKDMDLTVWFPGWMPSLVNREPSSIPGHECVALSRQYTLPNGSVENVSYYYWKAVECINAEGLLSFICEKPRQYTSGGTNQECYTDTGEEYRGNVHVTKDGLPCQNWTLSRTTNLDTNSDRGLGNHNLCRNPDGDVSPWCWTNVTTEEFAYCAIPQCHIRNSSKSRQVVQECPKGQFYCHKSSQGRCIASMYQCDGETDCEHSEDETGCDYILPRFTKIENMLSKATVRKTFGTIPVELCAKLCYEEKKFTCKSFSYRKTWKYCYLSSEEDPVDSRSSSADYDMYVLKTT